VVARAVRALVMVGGDDGGGARAASTPEPASSSWPASACFCIVVRSSGVSGPGLSRIRSGTAILPTSLAGRDAPARHAGRAGSSKPSAIAIRWRVAGDGVRDARPLRRRAGRRVRASLSSASDVRAGEPGMCSALLVQGAFEALGGGDLADDGWWRRPARRPWWPIARANRVDQRLVVRLDDVATISLTPASSPSLTSSPADRGTAVEQDDRGGRQRVVLAHAAGEREGRRAAAGPPPDNDRGRGRRTRARPSAASALRGAEHGVPGVTSARRHATRRAARSGHPTTSTVGGVGIASRASAARRGCAIRCSSRTPWPAGGGRQRARRRRRPRGGDGGARTGPPTDARSRAPAPTVTGALTMPLLADRAARHRRSDGRSRRSPRAPRAARARRSRCASLETITHASPSTPRARRSRTRPVARVDPRAIPEHGTCADRHVSADAHPAAARTRAATLTPGVRPQAATPYRPAVCAAGPIPGLHRRLRIAGRAMRAISDPALAGPRSGGRDRPARAAHRRRTRVSHTSTPCRAAHMRISSLAASGLGRRVRPAEVGRDGADEHVMRRWPSGARAPRRTPVRTRPDPTTVRGRR